MDVFGLAEYRTADYNAWHCSVAIWRKTKVSLNQVVADDLEGLLSLSSIAGFEWEGEWPVVDSIPLAIYSE